VVLLKVGHGVEVLLPSGAVSSCSSSYWSYSSSVRAFWAIFAPVAGVWLPR
jgi:hypothetical protein